MKDPYDSKLLYFDSKEFVERITLAYHRLHHSKCKRERPMNFLNLLTTSKTNVNEQHVNIYYQEARNLFAYLKQKLNVELNDSISTDRFVLMESKSDKSDVNTSNLVSSVVIETPTLKLENISTNNLSIYDIPNENQSVLIEEEKLSYSEQVSSEQPVVIIPTTSDSTNQHQSQNSIRFPSLIEFWKFLLKIFLLTIILLISAYLIIRTLLWLIENMLRPGGASPPGILDNWKLK